VFESLDEKEDFDETTMDACLIAAGQRAEHCELAANGTLVASAQAMGHTEAAKLLQPDPSSPPPSWSRVWVAAPERVRR
jgi:ferritin-like metal-binding protein YciE